MPLFRIMGGPSSSSSSGGGGTAPSNLPATSANLPTNPSHNSNNAVRAPPPPPPAPPTVSRYTYPGQRAATLSAGAPPPPGGGQPQPAPHQLHNQSHGLLQMPTEPPRMGSMHQQHHQQHHQHHLSGAATASASASPFSLSLNTNGTSGTSTALSSSLSSSGSSAAAGSTTSNPTPANPTTTNSNSSNTVLRGSAVQPGARVPPPATPAQDSARPGAYQVTRTSSGPSQVYRVTVPQGVRPGSEFTVHAGPRRVRVRCPVTSRPGQSLQITLPPEPETHHLQLRMAPLTAVDVPGGGAVAMTQEVQKVNEQAHASGGTAQSFLVSIPPNIHPGMQFTVNVSGQRFMVTCPASAGPGMKVRIVPPTLPEEPEAAPKTQIFEVAVPHGVQPGQPFALVANGQRVLVTCPPNVQPGQKIRFQLPVSEVVGNIQLSYESEKTGWSRTIRVSDLKFQWVRLDGNHDPNNATDRNNDRSSPRRSSDSTGPLKTDPNEDTDGPGPTTSTTSSSSGGGNAVDLNALHYAGDFRKSAYVRKLTYLEGNDARMRTGRVELVPASEAVVESRLVLHNRTLLSYSDIAQIQGKGLDDKTEWFQVICAKLAPAWEDGHIKIVVRRKHLLLDSVDAIMSLGRDDLRKRWRIEFLGEPGIDAGGLTREWFELVTEAVYDPAFGLWLPSVNNQACVNINPASGISCPEDHLVYFRFLGRVLGRALFDRQTVKGHMVRTLYKHLLGWPVTFEDIQTQDEDLYKSLKKVAEMEPEHVSCMCLDFTVTEESMGVRQDINLVENGSEREVTGENLNEYLEANLKYRLLDRTKSQLTELLLGFFDIIPEPALTIFDANELELILCGLPNIDMDDWRANTLYSGLYKGRHDPVVQWFWEVVSDDFDQEMKARLLQFVTGTSGVPSRGFSVLQGNDGNIKKFTIHGVDASTCVYPRSHTCFNRIDLPNYTNKKELHDKLRTAVTMCAVGFGME